MNNNEQDGDNMNIELIKGIIMGVIPGLVFIIPFIKSLLEGKKLSNLTKVLMNKVEEVRRTSENQIISNEFIKEVFDEVMKDVLDKFEKQAELHDDQLKDLSENIGRAFDETVLRTRELVKQSEALLKRVEESVKNEQGKVKKHVSTLLKETQDPVDPE